ncbi:SusD/RagB family nutrient-binding outer membrane lipoprotein [Gaoshiqia sp. Z1-71]|uniref:SusD/RagB family nutrient-binding outer membrane lipoprotein n=1 Tax=Gaoshiqia hydrogeniformans TaxID=3290090 RepID=UPI003BF8FB9B
MKNKSKHIGLVSILILSLLFGCNDFEDMNTNPDTTTQVSASMLCTNVVLRVAKFGGIDAKALISESALPKYVGYANEGQMDAQYNKIGSVGFDALLALPNIEKMVEYAMGDNTENSYRGVAKFARAYLFYRLTMQVGDIPYSEAGKGSGDLYKPAYDSQESVLIGILDELKEAEQYFANGITFTGDPTPYNGNPDKWRRATNALALKVLMTLSAKENVTSLNVKTRFAQIVSGGYLLEAGTGFFGLNYSSLNRQPLYSTSPLFTGRTIPSSLLVDSLKSLNDRRLYYFAEPSAAEIAAGKSASEPAAYVGVDVEMDYAMMNANHSANVYSLINLRYQQEEANEPRRLLTYAEQQLILAEARIRGWITAGTAQEYYESGVKSALAAMMSIPAGYAHGNAIDQNYIDSYFTGNAAFKSTSEEQLKQIWMQRYILNFMQDPYTAYFDYRRTGYPVFPINPLTSLNENNKNALPVRWLYPGSETSYNRENLEEALNRQYDGYDEINKLMWLLK